MLDFLGKLLDSNEREVSKLKPLVAEVNNLEKRFGQGFLMDLEKIAYFGK